MPLRSWLSRNKMLAKYPFAVKLVFRFRVSATDRFYFLFFSPLCSQFFLKFSLLRIPLKVFDNGPISLSQSLLLPQHKPTQRTDLSFRSHFDLSIERVCLGTNMADSNRRQGKSHVGENQELSLLNFNLVPRVLSLPREDPGNEVALIKDVRAKIFYSIDFF